MKRKTTQACIFILFIFLTFIPSQGSSSEETIDKTYTIDGAQPVDFEFLDNDGDVFFSSWERDEVHILIHKEVRSVNGRRSEQLLKETKIEISQHNNSFRIRIRYPRIRGFFFISNSDRVKVTSEIKVPATTNLDCRLDDGDITIERLNGKFTLETDDGTIRVTETQGSVGGNSDDGRINLENFSGDASLGSDDGDLLLSGNFTMLDLRSDDGDIRVKNAANSSMDKNWQIKTDDGDVEFYFAASFSADVLIDTDDGRIDSQLPIAFKKLTSERNLSGKINDGGYLITIKTDDGDISLKELKF